ncbi:hypothetical protein PFMALIP_05901, partial [Plasmodium falciparum MaliPS096_E11]
MNEKNNSAVNNMGITKDDKLYNNGNSFLMIKKDHSDNMYKKGNAPINISSLKCKIEKQKLTLSDMNNYITEEYLNSSIHKIRKLSCSDGAILNNKHKNNFELIDESNNNLTNININNPKEEDIFLMDTSVRDEKDISLKWNDLNNSDKNIDESNNKNEKGHDMNKISHNKEYIKSVSFFMKDTKDDKMSHSLYTSNEETTSLNDLKRVHTYPSKKNLLKDMVSSINLVKDDNISSVICGENISEFNKGTFGKADLSSKINDNYFKEDDNKNGNNGDNNKDESNINNDEYNNDDNNINNDQYNNDDNNINNDEYNNIDQYHHCGDTIKQKETPSIAHKIKHEAISENDMNSEKSYSSQLLYEDKLYYMLNNNSLENLNYTVIEKYSSNVKNIKE